jgi:hypothetical protein
MASYTLQGMTMGSTGLLLVLLYYFIACPSYRTWAYIDSRSPENERPLELYNDAVRPCFAES